MGPKIISILFILFCVNLNAQQYLGNDGIITFFSEAPIENIAAKNKKVSAVFDSKSKDLTFQLSISDFIFKKSLMQEHFNENYLESDKFPKSTFVGTVIKGGDNAEVNGDLTIHGITKTVNVSGSLENIGKEVLIKADFSIKLEDYNIDIPKIMFYNIAEEIDVKVNIKLKEK